MPLGEKKCGKICKIGPFTEDKTNTVLGTASGYKHKIKQLVLCDTENVICYFNVRRLDVRTTQNVSIMGRLEENLNIYCLKTGTTSGE